ncbi:MAG: alkaline phosphatase family protein [Proteobacteria bacterium]|nr:alkaline phosphatase family protein [bacterium]MBU4287998.1 alkaline phosphatase family protein [Pseudomonadota bacterium]
MGLFNKLLKKERNRSVIIGLDGVPFSMLKDLKENSGIPNMSSLFDKGYFGKMNVCVPEISSVSWSSFMTGTQSGEHGIFGFIDLEPGTYKMYFPNFMNLKHNTLWDELSKEDKKAVVINMPATYPAKKINGALISGFVAIDINKAVYPTSIIPDLNKMGYRIDVDTMKARQDHDFLFQDLKNTLEGRRRAVDFLWKEIDWDLFIVVITGTDRLMHFLWNAYEDTGHSYHKNFLDYFKLVDSFVGNIYEKFLSLNGSKEDKNNFFMLSDHGFTKIKTEVYLNRWLQDNGYLKFQKDNPKTIMDIAPDSTAFALDPSRIHINMKGKYPFGKVDISDLNRVCEELKDGLEKLCFDDGNCVAKKVYFKEELYNGPYIDQAPDLVVLSHHGYDLKGRVSSPEVFGLTNLQGMHTQDDAFFFNSNGMQCNSIFEAKKIILESLKPKQ